VVEEPARGCHLAVVFSLLNWSLGWLLRLLLVVPTILTLGLLLLFTTYIVNTVLLWLADKLLASFEIQERARAAAVTSAITLVNWLFHFALWR